MAFKDYSIGVNLQGHDNVSGVLAKMGKNAQKSEHTLGAAAKKMGKALGAVAVAAAAAGTALAVSAVKGAIADEKAAAMLAKTLKNTTGATDKQIASVEKYIEKTSLSTGILDDELRPAMSRMLRSTHDVTKAQKLMSLAMDVTAGSPGKSLQQVTEALSKAYDGNFTALKRLGIKIDASTMKSKNFNTVAKQLSNTFGGQMNDYLQTSEGQLRLLQARFDHMTKALGFALLPALEKVTAFLVGTAMPQLQKWTDTATTIIGDLLKGDTSSFGKFVDNIKSVMGKAGDAMVAAAPGIREKLGEMLSKLGENLPGMIDKLGQMGSQWAKVFGDWISSAVPKMLEKVSELVNSLATYLSDHGSEIVASVVSWVWKSMPDLLINLGKLLNAIVTWVYTSAVPTLLNLLVAVGKSVIVGLWNGMAAAAPTVASKLGDVAKSLVAALTAPFRGAFNYIAEMWNKTIGSWSIDIPDWIPMIGGKTFSFPQIPTVPALAKGGIVSRPTLAMIGEAGPEAVVPLRGRGGLGTTVNVYVEGSVVAERDLVLKLRNEIGQLMRRQSVGTAAFGI